MSGIIGVKIKLMPESPSVNMEEIKDSAMSIVQKGGGKNREYLVEPIAFGLKALIAFFEWPEEKELEHVENAFAKIKGVSSLQMIDMRKIA